MFLFFGVVPYKLSTTLFIASRITIIKYLLKGGNDFFKTITCIFLAQREKDKKMTLYT